METADMVVFPDWAHWLAKDESGRWWIHEAAPTKKVGDEFHFGVWNSDGLKCMAVNQFGESIALPDVPWQDSVVEVTPGAKAPAQVNPSRIKKDTGMSAHDKERWAEFRENGFLLYVNQLLHPFGVSILVEYDDKGGMLRAAPERVNFRGFPPESVKKAYLRMTQYMLENAKDLMEDF